MCWTNLENSIKPGWALSRNEALNPNPIPGPGPEPRAYPDEKIHNIMNWIIQHSTILDDIAGNQTQMDYVGADIANKLKQIPH